MTFIGTQASSFSIVGATGVVTTSALFDYETGPTSYGDGNVATLGIQVVDGSGGRAQVALTVSVTDVNDAPVFGTTSYTGTVNEEQNSGSAVTFSTAIAATDEDNHSLTYSLIGKNISGNFHLFH